VKRQYSGTLGKIGNCQITLSVHAVGERGTLPLGWRLYLPEEWCDDLPRRQKAKIPDEVCFRTKPQLAGDLCEQAVSWQLPTAPILADSAYGDDAGFRSRLAQQGLEYVVAVRAETSVYGPETSFAVPPRNGRTGRPRSVARPDRRSQSVRALAERLPPLAWQTLRCRTTPTGEDLASRFAFVRVVATNPVRSRYQPPRQEWLIIEWPSDADAPSDYWLSNLGEDEPPERLARLARLRWTVELDYRQLKGELGHDHYEGPATAASTTTPRSSPARTPSSPRSACAREPGGWPNAAAGRAATAARPALLGRPLPHLPTTRRPRPARALLPPRVTKSY